MIYSNGQPSVVGEGIRMEGASWVGALDMSGNVWEWIHNIYTPYPNHCDDVDNLYRNARILRGGSSRVSSDNLRVAHRLQMHPLTVDETFGFRCACSIE